MKTILKISVLGSLILSTVAGMAQSVKDSEVSKQIQNNVLLESDLYAENKQAALLELKTDKKNLIRKVKQGDKQSEIRIKELSTKEKKLSEDVREAQRKSLVIGRIQPLPPCPPKKECSIEGLGALLVPQKITKIAVQVLDKNNKLLGSLQQKPFMTDKKSGAKLYKFQLKENYSGPVTLKISRTTSNNVTENYEINRVIN